MGGFRDEVTSDGMDWVSQALQKAGGARIPSNFQVTAPVHTPQARRGSMPRRAFRNPQTEAFLSLLDLPYNLEPTLINLPRKLLDLPFLSCQFLRLTFPEATSVQGNYPARTVLDKNQVGND